MKIEEKIDIYLNEAHRFFVVTKRKGHERWIPGKGTNKQQAKITANNAINGVHKADIVGLGIVKAQDVNDAEEKAKKGEWVEKLK